MTRKNFMWRCLSDEDLRGADFRGANLKETILRKTNLKGADLRGANLEDAILTGANLRGADLTGARLVGAYGRWVDLTGAKLVGADLTGSGFMYAELCGADLTRAILRDTNLTGASLQGAILPDYQRLPDTGHFICYKQVVGAVLSLFVPHDALRTSCLISGKCRVSRAKVVGSSDAGTSWDNLVRQWTGGCAQKLTYRLDHWALPDDYDDDIREECTHGIHVFKTYQEAEDYCL